MKTLLVQVLEAMKTGSGGRPWNEAASVRMLALFQDKVKLLSSLVSRPSYMSARHLDCNIACHMNATEYVMTKHSVRVKAKYMTHKASPITVAK